MINTREELLIALAEAAELEHDLACLYLFAAFSLKQRLNEGLSELQQGRNIAWKGAVLRVARQEMEHLAMVHNLLTAIGGAPHFSRPNLPQPSRYYPPDTPFTLEKFSLASLKRFVEFERRADQPGAEAAIAPDQPVYQHVGELYARIRQGFLNVDAKTLFVGPSTAQDHLKWGRDVNPVAVSDRDSAVKAIDRIIEQGEGTPQAGPESHYEAFRRIYKELKDVIAADPGFDPARPVISDPLTRLHRDTAGTNVISDPKTRDLVELFDIAYVTLLLTLTHYYTFGDETDEQRKTLRENVALPLMKAVIRPLGALLTELPMGPDHGGFNAGPSFELYGTVALSPIPKIAWKLIRERIDAHAKAASDLAGANPGLGDIAQALTEISRAVTKDMPGGEF